MDSISNPVGHVETSDGARKRLVPSSERSGRKVRATFYVSAELLDELRDITVALSGPPDRLTLSDLAEGAFRREVERLKRVHMKGIEFREAGIAIEERTAYSVRSAPSAARPLVAL